MDNTAATTGQKPALDEKHKNLPKLSPEAKKTIWEWTVYLAKALAKAILEKISSDSSKPA